MRSASSASSGSAASAGGRLEDALDICLVRAGTHDAPPRLAPEQQVERLGEHGLARAGLAGDRVQAPVESQLGALDQQQVPDTQLDQHTLRLAAAPVELDEEHRAASPRPKVRCFAPAALATK